MGIVNADRVFKLLAKDERLTAPTHPQSPSWRGAIRFEGVWFAYVDKETGSPIGCFAT